MRVTVDRDRCQGHARCEAICPQVFELDDLGYAIGGDREVPHEHEEAARRAAANCPERAIEVEA